MLGIFDRGGERGYLKRMQKASDLFSEGEIVKDRALYERLIVQAIELYGPDAEQALHTRGALATAYGEEAPERACQLLEQVVQDDERLFGPVDHGRLHPRLDLVAMYGLAGDYAKCHELSETLLADCDRLLGPEDPHTARARVLLHRSAGDLARADLAALVDIPSDSFVEEPAPADSKERLLAAAFAMQAARSYRARMLWESKPSNGASDEGGYVEYDFEFVRPDSFHLKRGVWGEPESDEGLFDEWIVIGDEHYSNPGLWWRGGDDETKAGRERENRLLLAHSYVDLLREATPIAIGVRSGEQAVYLVAEYVTVPQAWSDLFDGPSSLREARTSLWIDLAQGLLRKAEGTFVSLSPEGGAEVEMSFKHGFASYGEDIDIDAPELGVELEGDE